jgi:hypothetical protein
MLTEFQNHLCSGTIYKADNLLTKHPAKKVAVVVHKASV